MNTLMFKEQLSSYMSLQMECLGSVATGTGIVCLSKWGLHVLETGWKESERSIPRKCSRDSRLRWKLGPSVMRATAGALQQL